MLLPLIWNLRTNGHGGTALLEMNGMKRFNIGLNGVILIPGQNLLYRSNMCYSIKDRHSRLGSTKAISQIKCSKTAVHISAPHT